ncbi:MAG: T9SS type A sorting domain-containing protein [Brumimicrobium sp.]|nr:T9SS type A sorting domain-containing protein [Brumimicrobium sp.]
MRIKFLKTTTLLLGLGLSMLSFSQTQIGNSNFETWGGVGSGNERPTNWNNMMNGNMCFLCGLGKQQTTWRESTEIRPGTSGQYSVKIKSGSYAGKTINGNMTLGELVAPNTEPLDGYTTTKRANATFNEPFTGKPDSLVMWVKYSVTNNQDSARVSATIHGDYDYRDPANSGSLPYTVARAVKNFQTGNVWKRLSIPFNYVGPATTPYYILVNIASSYAPGVGVVGATLFADDLELIYNPPIVVKSPSVQNLIENQVGTTLTELEISHVYGTATSREWKYATTSGGPYTSFSPTETGATYTPQFATEGTYYVVCVGNFGGTEYTSNEVQINVVPFSNSIAPTLTQNLEENELGDDLTVTETPTANSREWKYATTSGGPYTSFSPSQMGTIYTPMFVSAGTYFVVCESTIGNITETSNEVEIDVIAAVSNSVNITPTATQNLIENQTGTTLNASEGPNAADSREWKYATTSGGPYSSFSPAETSASYTPEFATAGTYYVVCVSDFAGDIKTSNEITINVVEFTNSISPLASQTLIETQIGDDITASESPAADSREWKYATTSGGPYTSFSPAETGSVYAPQFATADTYYVVCESTIDGITITSDEVEVIVVEFTNEITPATTQHLLVNEAGDELTVTESPVVDSREWKFAISSGGPYTSFSPAETAETYTPLFATADTYYVVCESTIDGITITSDEVEIVVDETSSIATENNEFVKIFSNEGSVMIDLTNSNLDNATVQVVSIEGKLITSNNLKSNQMNIISVHTEKGIYLVTVTNGNEVYRGKVFID